MYGIQGDDGKKYQPLNLPREFRKDGAIVKFSAVPRDDVFTSIMWGAVVEIKQMAPFGANLSEGERTAIYVLEERMAAFNSEDLARLQKLDVKSQSLSPQSFHEWLNGHSDFKLRYVNITSADSMTISGYCFYSRGLGGEMSLHDTGDVTAINFVLERRNNGWMLTDSGPVRMELEELSLAQIQKKAQAKYGTDDLAKL